MGVEKGLVYAVPPQAELTQIIHTQVITTTSLAENEGGEGRWGVHNLVSFKQ